MSKKLDIQAIKERADKLENVKKQLKAYFVGLDDIIDEFINNIKIWYILPEVQTRPLIVNLWGMTGLGKTDLVRRFVNYINFNDRFIEIQMDIDNSSYYNNKVQDHIENVLDNANEEGILLLDEMQRFRTVDEMGKEIKNTKYNDLWMLLSDGKFESDSKNRKELFEMMFDILYYEDARKVQEEENAERQSHEEVDSIASTPSSSKGVPKKNKVERKYKTWAYQAKRLKKLLKLEESVDEIMTWDETTKIEYIQKGLKSKVAFEGNVYSKLLIIVSGNLDEAFKMSDEVGDVDTDADLFYEFSKKVNILNIKKALNRRFKPEQIARFGNIHIIYPSLNKASYYEIIRKKITSICTMIHDKHQIEIKVDKSIYEVIYKNGVFPTQGVRPVLSTISSIFENSLPSFIYTALLSNVEKFSIKHSNGYFYSIINKKRIKYQIPRVIENIKSEKTTDEDALTAVHEAGHAVAYAILFKISPTQIVCKTADDEAQGFIGCHQFTFTKQKYEERIKVSLAGKIAEQIVFGKDQTSTGAFSDIRYATATAAAYVRKMAFNQTKSFVSTETADAAAQSSHDIDGTNKEIEDLIVKLTKEAEILLNNNRAFLKKVVAELFEKKELKPSDFVEIAREFVPGIKELHPKETFMDNYYERMSDFLK